MHDEDQQQRRQGRQQWRWHSTSPSTADTAEAGAVSARDAVEESGVTCDTGCDAVRVHVALKRKHVGDGDSDYGGDNSAAGVAARTNRGDAQGSVAPRARIDGSGADTTNKIFAAERAAKRRTPDAALAGSRQPRSVSASVLHAWAFAPAGDAQLGAPAGARDSAECDSSNGGQCAHSMSGGAANSKVAGAPSDQNRARHALGGRAGRTILSSSSPVSRRGFAAPGRPGARTKLSRPLLASSSSASSARPPPVALQSAVDAVSGGLNGEQSHALKLIATGSSVFFTGSAGTGKTHLLNCIREVFGRANRAEQLFVTASTGAAATLIRGTTVHSFAGVGLGKESAQELIRRVQRFKDARERWRQCRTLVIDEVSMISAELFDKLDTVARAVRGVNRPFGGVQLVVSGDFYQLPPVGAGDDNNKAVRQQENFQRQQHAQQTQDGRAAAAFVFESRAWRRAIQHAIELKHVYRQADGTFSAMLDELRRGQVSDATVRRLDEHQRCPPTPDAADNIKATRVYAHNAQVNRVNESELSTLKAERGGRVHTFTAVKKGAERYTQQLLSGPGCLERLELVPGAQVLLTRNLDVSDGLVNGSVGTVIGFANAASASASAALSHRDARHAADTSRINNHGGGGCDDKWPIVVFPKSASPERHRVVEPVAFTIEQGGVQLASVTQVPLKLAWALSIHRCQGMTLDRIQVDLRGVFESGMLYVALSRARTLDGLVIAGFRRELVMASARVHRFYASLRACTEETAAAAAARAQKFGAGAGGDDRCACIADS